jgi:hypothetical protein
VASLDLRRFAAVDALLPALPYYRRSARIQRLAGQLLRLIEGRSRRRIGAAGPQPWAETLRRGGLRAATALLSRPTPAADDYAALYARFQAKVCRLHGSSLFIDGSKGIVKLLALQRLDPSFGSGRVIHLLRDPRAFAASAKRNTGWSDMAAIARLWCRLHQSIATLADAPFGLPYHQLRYEDLCREPQPTMDAIFRFINLPPHAVCHAPNDPRKHHLIGNRMLRHFDGEIRLDQGWRQRLSSAERATIRRVAAPVAQRFGYSLTE